MIESWTPAHPDAGEQALSLLRAQDPNGDCSLTESDVEVLVRAYQRRVNRGADVVGIEDLLGALEHWPDDVVLTTSIAADNTVLNVWLDGEAQTIVGNVIGNDRRA